MAGSNGQIYEPIDRRYRSSKHRILLFQITLSAQKLVNENEIRIQIRTGLHECCTSSQQEKQQSMRVGLGKKEIKVRVRVTRTERTLNF